MPELLRNLAGRLRAVVANRRASPRKNLRLPCSISIHDAKATDPARLASLEAYTRDVSMTGVAIVAPAIRIGDRYLNESALRLTVEYPTGAMTILVASVRYEKISSEGEKTRYLIGTRIVEMSDEDRERFEAHLRQLT